MVNKMKNEILFLILCSLLIFALSYFLFVSIIMNIRIDSAMVVLRDNAHQFPCSWTVMDILKGGK